ncbi:MAG: phospho-sugar mutase [Firmicutes bacterium]|nr:phospho-sugar mutase [Bacillota bacterium]
MDPLTQNHWKRWMDYSDLDSDLKQELHSLHGEELESAFYRYLDFGTAGMRGLIGPGTNRMNRYTVRRTTEGLARYLESGTNREQERGVVIAFDSRLKSPQFAEEAAAVLATHGIRVHLFPSLRPTPFLSFAVRHLEAAAGIMITASHNPAAYNGYKMYGEDGAQMPSHKMEAILRNIEAIQDELTIPVLSPEEGRAQGWIETLGETVDQAYMEHLLRLSLRGKREANQALQVVFTPLHGTGNLPVRHVLEKLGYTGLYIVPEQEHPDPAFSTVATPNPEEPAAFARALEYARKREADLVLATDPDADRLGIRVKSRSGDYLPFNGNQIGALLLYYLLTERKQQGTLPSNGVIVQSLVTSDLGRSIAHSFGVAVDEVLTGFKYIAEKIAEYESDRRYQFLFGYEESGGYLLDGFVRDKDAIQAAMLICEAAAHYKERGLTLDEVLHRLYEEHGWYRETLASFTFSGKAGQERMTAIMDRLRHRPPKRIGGLAVRKQKDYIQGLDGFPPTQMLKYILEDGSWIAVRPSGTEPKIKLYLNTVGPSETTAQNKLNRIQKDMHDWLEA